MINEKNIYSTLPKKVIVRDDTYNDRMIIRNFLRDNEGCFFNASRLGDLLGFSKSGNQAKIRLLITKLIELDNTPIIATRKGFAYVLDRDLIKTYAESLENRRKGLDRRINKVIEIYEGL